MVKHKILPYLAIVSSITFWGISYIASDISLRYMHPITLVMLRCVIAAALLLVVWRIKEPKTRIQKVHIPRMFISGFVGIVCYFIFEFYGIKLTSPAVAAIILAVIPIISLLAQRMLGKEMLTVLKVAGVAISLIGVALVIGIGKAEQNTNSQVIGYLCMLGAALSWVVFNYITMPLYDNYSPLTITTFQMVAGTIAIVPIYLFSGQSLPPVNVDVVANVLFLSVFCSAVGILFYMYALRSLGILTVTLFINIQPFVTVAASMMILKEFLSMNQMLGGLLVIGAVYLSTYKKKQKKQNQPEKAEI
ncbi:MAG: EamA family transporter [Eubacteriales bacterium]